MSEQPDPTEPTIRPAADWRREGDYTDIVYETADPFADGEGGGRVAKITINRPEVHNAFRPRTVEELIQAFVVAREDPEVGGVILTGAGAKAFCSGGDQKARGDSGYVGDDQVGKMGIGRFLVTDLHVQIRRLPKPVVAMVAGWAVGGGHVLHVICDLTIAAENARTAISTFVEVPRFRSGSWAVRVIV